VGCVIKKPLPKFQIRPTFLFIEVLRKFTFKAISFERVDFSTDSLDQNICLSVSHTFGHSRSKVNVAIFQLKHSKVIFSKKRISIKLLLIGKKCCLRSKA